MMFNFKPLLRGGDLKLTDDTIVLSSDTISAESLPIKRDIQVKVLDSGYTPVPNTNVVVNVWEEDPACYLSDAEIGIEESAGEPRRVAVTPYRGRRHAAAG